MAAFQPIAAVREVVADLVRSVASIVSDQEDESLNREESNAIELADAIQTLRRLHDVLMRHRAAEHKHDVSDRIENSLRPLVQRLEGSCVPLMRSAGDEARHREGHHETSGAHPVVSVVPLVAAVEWTLRDPSQVMLRKRRKQADDLMGTGTNDVGIVSTLRLAQGRERAELFSGKTSLRPLVDPASSACDDATGKMTSPTAFRCSPQAFKLMKLNAEAEAAYALHLKCLHTRLCLLQGMEDVTSFAKVLALSRQLLRQSRLWNGSPWCRVMCCDHGVVQLQLRESLTLDLRLAQETPHSKRWWLVVSHRWIVQAAVSSSSSCAAEEEGRVTTPPALMRVSVLHSKEVASRIRSSFADDGFAQGVLTGLRAVASVWMDIIHSQILEMREAYFSLPSTQGMFLVDGQVGFSVSVRFTPPRAASIFAALVAPFVDVRFSLELECRTVLCRAIFGTDVASAEVEDVVSGGVVNAPAILWKIFNKLLLMQANAEEVALGQQMFQAPTMRPPAAAPGIAVVEIPLSRAAVPASRPPPAVQMPAVLPPSARFQHQEVAAVARPSPVVLALGLSVPFELLQDVQRRSSGPSQGIVRHVESLVATDLVQHLGGDVSRISVTCSPATNGVVGKPPEAKPALLLTLTFVNTGFLQEEPRAAFARKLKAVVVEHDAFRGLRRNLQSLVGTIEPIALRLDICRIDGVAVVGDVSNANVPSLLPNHHPPSPRKSADVRGFPNQRSSVEEAVSIFAVMRSMEPEAAAVDIFLPSPPPASRRLDLSDALPPPPPPPAPPASSATSTHPLEVKGRVGGNSLKIPATSRGWDNLPATTVDNSFGFLSMSPDPPQQLTAAVAPPLPAAASQLQPQQPTFLGATVVTDAEDASRALCRGSSSNRHVPAPSLNAQGTGVSSPLLRCESSTQTAALPLLTTKSVQTEVFFIIPEQIVTEQKPSQNVSNLDQPSAYSDLIQELRDSKTENRALRRKVEELLSASITRPVAAPLTVTANDTKPSSLVAKPPADGVVREVTPPSHASSLSVTAYDELDVLGSRNLVGDDAAAALTDDGEVVPRPHNACPNASSYTGFAPEPVSTGDSPRGSTTTELLASSEPEDGTSRRSSPPVSRGTSSASEQQQNQSPPSPGSCFVKCFVAVLIRTREAYLKTVELLAVVRDQLRVDILGALKSQDVRLSDVVVSHTFPEPIGRTSKSSAEYSIGFAVSLRVVIRLKPIVTHVLSAYLRHPSALQSVTEVLDSALGGSSSWVFEWESFAVEATPLLVGKTSSREDRRADVRRRAYIVQGGRNHKAVAGEAPRGPPRPSSSGTRGVLGARAQSPQPTPPAQQTPQASPAEEAPHVVPEKEGDLRQVRAFIMLGPRMTFRALKDAIKLRSSSPADDQPGLAEELLRCVHFDLVEQLSHLCGEGDYITVRYAVPPAGRGTSSRVPVGLDVSLSVNAKAAGAATRLLAQYLASPAALPCTIECFATRVVLGVDAESLVPRVDLQGSFINDDPLLSFT